MGSARSLEHGGARPLYLSLSLSLFRSAFPCWWGELQVAPSPARITCLALKNASTKLHDEPKQLTQKQHWKDFENCFFCLYPRTNPPPCLSISPSRVMMFTESTNKIQHNLPHTLTKTHTDLIQLSEMKARRWRGGRRQVQTPQCTPMPADLWLLLDRTRPHLG